MNKERGSALVIAMLAMALLAALILGFSRNTDIDLLISRNTRIMKQSFLWSDSGIGMGQELISISEYYEGALDNATFTYTFDNDAKIYGKISGNTIYKSNSTNPAYITLEDDDGNPLSEIEITFLDSIVNDGTSVIFGAGYEGVGKGAGAGGTIARIYSIKSTGHSEEGSLKKAAAIYRSTSK